MMNIIEIKSLCKSYDKKSVLNNFSLSLEEGTTTCIMGNSGCGKTTLLRIVAGLEKPDSGEVKIKKNRISFVFQEDRLCEDFSPISNIKFVTGNNLSDETIKENLNALGLHEKLNKPVSLMSGGMKRRVAIARALLSDYDVLLMDEPFKGLDIELKSSVIEYVKEKTKGKTVIIVTHDLQEAENLSKNIVKM